MKKTVKNILAVFGAVFIAFIVLSLAVSIFFGGSGIASTDKVGVVRIEGVITDSLETNRRIHEFAERKDIKAIVVRIDSPGGAVGPSQEIYRELKKVAGAKTVIASMGAVAASGGYYIAAAADRIVANPGTITGSIGVIIEFMNVEGLLSKVGLKGEVIKSGRFKDTGSPLRELREDEKKLIQALIDDVNNQFIDAVAEGRSLKRADVALIADGRILSGLQAKKKGLVDTLGSLNDAVDIAAELSGIDGKPDVVYARKNSPGFFTFLFGEEASGRISGLYSGMNILYMAKPFN